MSSEQLEILCDGLMVYEVDPICEKLVAKGVRFKVVRVTDEEAGIVNSRKDNCAIVLSFAGYNDFKDEGRRDLIDGIGMVDAYFCPHCLDDAWRGFDERLGEELAYIGRAEVPETAWAQEDGTMVIFRNEEEEPEVKVLRPGSRVYRYCSTRSWRRRNFWRNGSSTSPAKRCRSWQNGSSRIVLY